MSAPLSARARGRAARHVREWTRHGIARFRFYRSRTEWQLYWMRQDLHWHRYEPDDEMPTDLASLVALVEADRYRAFFG